MRRIIGAEKSFFGTCHVLELGGKPSRHIELVATALRYAGHQVTIETVQYEFQRGGNQMMKIQR